MTYFDFKTVKGDKFAGMIIGSQYTEEKKMR